MTNFFFPSIILIVLVATQCAKAQPADGRCPNGEPTVACFVSPCSLPRPERCPRDARCEDDYCGGCNRHYYDAFGNEICNECDNITRCGPPLRSPTIQCSDGSTGGNTGRCIVTRDRKGCGWEIRECPRNCTPVACRLACPYGFQLDSDGCPICECNPSPDCRLVLCAPRTACPYDATIRPGDCCPTCIDPCYAVTCPQIRCAPGYHSVIPRGHCCPECVPDTDCNTAILPNSCRRTRPTCPEHSFPVLRDCCYFCEPIDCTSVDCARPDCGPNEKLVVADGSCCPTCEPVPDCSLLDCATVACPSGEQLTPTDLNCCGRCTPPNNCEAVLCMRPEGCSPYAYIRRDGSCCPQCPLCKDSDRKVCNTNDDIECRGGFWRGIECTDQVPDDQRDSKTLTVKFCGKNCEQLDGQTLRLYIANRARVPAKYITVNSLGRAADGCCWRYEVIIAAEAGSYDVAATEPTVAAALTSDPSFTVEQTTNDVAMVKASFVLLGIVLLFV